MANIKSAKKRISVIEKKTALNRVRKSQIKTAIRRFEDAVAVETERMLLLSSNTLKKEYTK
ncbi:ribosomal S20 family protein [Clostridioides difficile CD88]|nr:30S ribosomal protein S20 [Clostridioides difficile]EQL06332.1 ribosomal S20 family protein [Clostridioides difficile CD88]